MSFLRIVKDNFTTLPYAVGKPVSLVPYSLRPGLGKLYRARKKEIGISHELSTLDKKKYIFERVRDIAVYAYENVPFYSDLYRSSDVQPNRFGCFDDLINLPIINKSDLQGVDLEYRSCFVKGRSLVNTGGSSGQPLEFYIEPSSIAHEWAHMHHVWSKVGFIQSDMRIVFGGRSDVRDIVQYDSARHQINVDLYSGWEEVANRLLSLNDKYAPKYLHGYPSAIFDFVLWLEATAHPLLPVLQSNIRGILLGSELPVAPLRKEVERLLNCQSVSWYGHTERAVLAFEAEGHGVYYPFVSYGYAEASPEGRLICTSYYNRASPLVRYDTGDYIAPVLEGGVLTSFSVSKGREGEFVIDKSGNKIFLTGLIFGRHHKLFERARHIQIHQPARGIAEVLVTPKSSITPADAAAWFDAGNVQIDFVFNVINEPIRTKAGKVPLLVKKF